MKYIKLFLLLGVMTLIASCESEELSSQSIFKDDEVAQNDFDKWLMTNYTQPYNIQFNYLYNDKLSDNYYNVVPADVDKSKAIAILVKHVWLDAYTEVAGEEFMKKNSFRVMQLIGSPEFDSQNKIVLGTAEGGLKILLFRINELDPDNIYVNQANPYADKRSKPLDLNYWYFHTMHHEFCHILHQKKSYSTEFQTISAGKYHTSDWVNVTDEDAAAEGFVTGYGSSAPDEDFAEVYSTYVTHTDEAWNNILSHGDVVQKDETGQIVYARDTKGNYVYKKDDTGNQIPMLDENGDLVPIKDAAGKIVYQTDNNGNYIYFLNSKGNRIPKYSIHKDVRYYLDNNGEMQAYFVYEGKGYPITTKAGDPIYQTTVDGDTIYDKNGIPVPEYFRKPMIEYEKEPVVDTFGRDALVKKLEILKTYFKDSWGIDLDKLREVVLRRSNEAMTLDLKTLK